MRLVCIALILLVACGTSDVAVQLDQPFKLKYGGSAYAAQGVQVGFVEVVSDSRCPKSVQCVWEGEAQVRLRLTVSGQSRSLMVGTISREGTALGYRIRLDGLQPYPETDAKIEPQRYVAQLVVSRV